MDASAANAGVSGTGTGTGAGTGTAAAADAGEAGAPGEAGAFDERPYLEAAPKGGRAIGHTSVVFKIELANGRKCAWKPASRRAPRRYRGEIAARRLAVALGIPNVPPAFPRAFRDAELRPVLAGERYGAEAIVEAGLVRGALIPWIDKLELLPLESDPTWKSWLRRGAAIPDDKRTIAADASTMVAFDFLTGNWDRWSGGNIGFDRASGHVLFIDNDGAFFEIVPKDALARARRQIGEIDRWSRSFVARVRALDDAALARALGEEPPGTPLVSAKALAGVAARRDEWLRAIDAASADAGDDETLYFP